MRTATIASTPEEIEELRQGILNIDERFRLEFTKDSDDHFLKEELEAVLMLAPLLYNKHWHIIESSTSRVFVTSDNPVILLPSASVGMEKAIVTLPLSPKRCLTMSGVPGKADIIKVSRESVNEVNEQIILQAHKQVFSNLEAKDFQIAFDQTKPGHNTRVVVQ